MKRRMTLTVATALTACVWAGTASAEPGDGSRASCAGYLASYANPNNGFVIHALEKPLAESLGVPMGTLQSGFAGQHNGSLEACIP